MFNFDGYCLPRFKKTNIVAKRPMEGAIREIKKCPKKDCVILLQQCAP